MIIYLIIFSVLFVGYWILPKKYRLWVGLGFCILLYHFLRHKLKINNLLSNFFGSGASKKLKKIKEQYINEDDIKNVSRSDSITYIESVLNDLDK